tara:strand:- start:6722 stop:7378 length:657 start_codon:yes stop_codon:yes gene_type:complete
MFLIFSQKENHMFKVIVAGSRKLNVSSSFVARKIQAVLRNKDPKEIEIVSGGARGADKLGEVIAKQSGYAIKQFIPEWDKFGKGAGYRRNEEMAKYADACIVFWDGESRGSKHMMDLAHAYNLQLRVYKNEQPIHCVSVSDLELETIPCKRCDGSGKVIWLKDNSVCYSCNGEGQRYIKHVDRVWEPVEQLEKQEELSKQHWAHQQDQDEEWIQQQLV